MVTEELVSHSLFECIKVVLGQCIRLCDYGNEVYARPETLHDFNVQGLESKGKGRMSAAGKQVYVKNTDV